MGHPVGALLFGVQIADVLAFGLACLLVMAVAMIAAVLPARRVARLDPVVALRTE
jgi:ABC-type antimicrobial peptide transport system permease subunit